MLRIRAASLMSLLHGRRLPRAGSGSTSGKEGPGLAFLRMLLSDLTFHCGYGIAGPRTAAANGRFFLSEAPDIGLELQASFFRRDSTTTAPRSIFQPRTFMRHCSGTEP